jgi:hypothetical protein
MRWGTSSILFCTTLVTARYYVACSCVTSLQLDYISAEEAEQVLDALLWPMSKAKLARLNISWYQHGGCSDEAWHALFKCVPFLVHLKELHTGQVPGEFAALLLDVLRQSSSLHTMTNCKYRCGFNSFDVSIFACMDSAMSLSHVF